MDGSKPTIPKDWGNLVRTKPSGGAKNTKRKCSVSFDARNVCQKTVSDTHMPPKSMQDACNHILYAIGRASGNPVENFALNLDPILSNVAYKDLVENLFGSDSNCVVPVIPLVTKAYEESFMREAVHSSERTCIMGSKCECNFISKVDYRVLSHITEQFEGQLLSN
jgi:hypothetical protein